MTALTKSFLGKLSRRRRAAVDDAGAIGPAAAPAAALPNRAAVEISPNEEVVVK